MEVIRRKKMYYTSKEANNMALGISAVLTVIFALYLRNQDNDIKILLVSALLMWIFFFYLMRIGLRVNKRKELEEERILKKEIKKILSERKKVKFSFDYFDEDCEDFIIKIVKEMKLDYYAYIENGSLMIEVRDSNGKIIYQKPISWRFFDENFYLK